MAKRINAGDLVRRVRRLGTTRAVFAFTRTAADFAVAAGSSSGTGVAAEGAAAAASEEPAAKRAKKAAGHSALLAFFGVCCLLQAAAAGGGCNGAAAPCSLNGVCQHSGVRNDPGRCLCDPGWRSDDCSVLRLGPAALKNGYRQQNVSSWGGSVIFDGGTYHMFVEEIVNNCGLDTYVRNMRVVHAVSKSSAAGPYTPANLVANFSASTPHAVRDPANGDWLVFATGCGREACLAVTECSGGTTSSGANMSPCPNGSRDNGSSVALGARAGHPLHAAPCKCPGAGHPVPGPECSVDWGTTVFRAPTPDGPWTLTAPLLDVNHPKLTHSDGTPVVMANPSALLLANGTSLVMYRDFWQKLRFPATNVLGLAISHTGWRGPYTDIIRKIVPAPFFNEDPHIYRGKRGSYHMLAHSLCLAWPHCTDVGGHASSADGIEWHYSSGAAFNTTVEFEDGTSRTFSRRERPELLHDPESGSPTHLITGVTEPGGAGRSDRSWTLVQPVIH